MGVTNMNAISELTVGHELQSTIRESVVSRGDDESNLGMHRNGSCVQC